QFCDWSAAFLSTTQFTPDEVAARAGKAMAYIASLVAQHRETKQDDLLGALVHARDEEDRLSEVELVSLATGLLVGGHETTALQIPTFVYVLLTNPDQLALLRETRDLVPSAVEELLRYVPLTSGAAE